MYFIKDCQIYTITSHTDNFIVAKRDKGTYTETFKKDEIDTIYATANDVIPDTLIEKSVFDIGELNGTKMEFRRS